MFDLIESSDSIDQDDPKAEKIDLKGEIKFESIEFAYPSKKDHKILKDFTCTFEIGKTTALVGPSGAGKSSIVQLIQRFYDPLGGRILIDDKNLKTLNLRQLRSQIGYVSQEPVLFNTTIRKNILMGKPNASEDEIISALKQTNAWEFVS